MSSQPVYPVDNPGVNPFVNGHQLQPEMHTSNLRRFFLCSCMYSYIEDKLPKSQVTTKASLRSVNCSSNLGFVDDTTITAHKTRIFEGAEDNNYYDEELTIQNVTIQLTIQNFLQTTRIRLNRIWLEESCFLMGLHNRAELKRGSVSSKQHKNGLSRYNLKFASYCWMNTFQ